MSSFNASLFISNELNRQLLNVSQEFAIRCLTHCAEKYGFDADEAIRDLCLSTLKVERNKPVVAKAAKVIVAKPSIPLPYNGEFNDSLCYALRLNNGLYTQCCGERKGNEYCKSCANQMRKSNSEIPEYGTIQQRLAADILEYTDPKGRKPISYTKIMKKNKITREQVEEEAGKFGITIAEVHFAESEAQVKRGRPSSKIENVEAKVKGVKGRPKKSKKVLDIESDDTDLFAELVAQAHGVTEEEEAEESLALKKQQEEQERAEKKAALEKEKAEKKAAAEAEKKAAAEAKKKAEEEARALKKQQEEQERAEKKAAAEAKKKAEEEARLLKKQQEEQERAEKKAAAEAKKKQKEEKKAEKPSKATKVAVEEEEEEEPDVVKKIKVNDKVYLKSKKTGIIYDYVEYTTNGEQVVVGQWNEAENRIDFTKNDSDEEEEEEYEE